MLQATSLQDEGVTKRRLRPNTGVVLDRLFRLSMVILTGFVLLGVLFVVGRSSIYKIHEYERGLHLRGGGFVSIDEPGWHMQIPLVDTVIIVKVNERLGYVERVAAMTSDDVTMDVSLQFTYRVTDPKTFALQVDNPERIIFEFVQGKLRDVVNTKDMTEVMHSRAEMNREVMAALVEKETQYGVEFVTVQIQGASPPAEVVAAIKDRMVAVQRQEQAQAEAAQRRTLADADFYAAQKLADGNAYTITTLAEAESERIGVTSKAEQIAVQAMLDELEQRGSLGEVYIQLLIAQALKENSKWIISGGQSGEGVVPRIEMPVTP
jgi:regulator of protease activity HflC (stomatin/prohibitin superfamily)